MSELLWTCADGAELSSEANGVRLIVARAPRGNGFRYQLLGRVGPAQARVALASGHREELRDAIDAAERAAHGFTAAP